ncbi:MAG: hypothetical protein J07HQW1_00408 [Haloquadratum walsbyi J07HQW1]|jgi:hypothetical protein|uniref:Uncharacterized protein n=1 Tax=Haloquadratum walsbyi J07HQW1 TaxID=1238424 RepID=U1PA26_9EURY|nr:MAG: hypothetical protein J07HQW1_00408 [Haloquadratum walsbyi J07HQW1]
MLYDAADNPGSLTPDALCAAYEKQLHDVITDVGVETIIQETDVDTKTIETLANIDPDTDTPVTPDLRTEDAAAILAAHQTRPDAESIIFELRDHLLMSMTTTVVDVDIIASNVDLDLSGQEVQQALEGRAAMTLAQLAAIQRFLAARNDQ